MRKTFLLLLSCISLSCATQSGSGADPTVGVNPDGSPKWVHRGSGAFDGAHGKAFYGVGIVSGIQNESLSRQTADNRARGEIAKIFDLYVGAMMKDYQRSTTAGDFKASAEEQDVVSAQKTITEVTLRGIEIKDHWINPQTQGLYALAVLDLNAINDALGNASQLNATIRDHVRANARRAFEDLDRELAKRNEPKPSVEQTEPTSSEQPSPMVAPQAEVTPTAEPSQPTAPMGEKKKITIGLKITGRGSQTVQTCFAEKIIGEGFELLEGSSDADILVQGQLNYQKGDKVLGTKLVVAELNIRVIDINNSKSVLALVETMKVGRSGLDQSVQLAVSRFCDSVVPKMAKQIRTALMR